jgi:hypothetical protein
MLISNIKEIFPYVGLSLEEPINLRIIPEGRSPGEGRPPSLELTASLDYKYLKQTIIRLFFYSSIDHRSVTFVPIYAKKYTIPYPRNISHLK